MVTVLLVHGLAASKKQWQPLIPYLDDVNVINFELPGHGKTNSMQFDWVNTISALHSLLPKLGNIIYVLHSFAASFLPEIAKIAKKNDKIILLEGIIHIDDAKWTQSSAFHNESLYENWLKKFRLGGRVILKSQLIKKHKKSDIDLWSKGFTEVNGNAIKIYSRKLIERLQTFEISSTLEEYSELIIYIRGEKSNLSHSCIETIKQSRIPLYIINESSHFPMLDNPKDLYEIIKKVLTEVS